MGFCSNCGSEMKEGALFCTQCGTKATDGVQQETIYTMDTSNSTPNIYVNYTTVDRKPNKNKMIGMAVVGVVALLAVFLIVSLIGLFTTPGYERPIKYVIEGFEEGKLKTMMKAIPDYIKKDFEDKFEEYYDSNTDNMIIERLETMYGKRRNISYVVKEKDKWDKEEIDELEDDIKDRYGEEVNIKTAYTLDLEMKMKGSENSTEVEDSLTVIKIGMRWYLSEFYLY